MKKLKALLLSICLLVTFIPTTVFADDTQETSIVSAVTPRSNQIFNPPIELANGDIYYIGNSNGQPLAMFGNHPYTIALHFSESNEVDGVLHNLHLEIVDEQDNVLYESYFQKFPNRIPIEVRIPQTSRVYFRITNYDFNTYTLHMVTLN